MSHHIHHIAGISHFSVYLFQAWKQDNKNLLHKIYRQTHFSNLLHYMALPAVDEDAHLSISSNIIIG